MARNVIYLTLLLPLVLAMPAALAQNNPSGGSTAHPSNNAAPQTTGSDTDLRQHQQHREQQPQGDTGSIDTTSGGAPASSPQGETPPGMQAAPEGSSKSIGK
ncbi:MAG TPA: hypothetical protein VFB45_10515 [Pseudolabrys sp.]|nr:hypothetical protein [Pseudolabrys sp.]